MLIFCLFAITICVSSALLFFIQPLIAHALLPALGGAPAVWNTCNVFFQGMLLAGYAYSFGISRRLRGKIQSFVHVIVIGLAVVLLPSHFHPEGMDTLAPITSLFTWLSSRIGVLIFLLCSTAPLIQHWYQMIFPGREPYPLYAASNTGSLLGLLLYPLYIEPRFGLKEQTLGIIVVFLIFALLMTLCAVLTFLFEKKEKRREKVPDAHSNRKALHWVSLAFLPSALMLSVTTHITTNIAPMPLLWVMPLSIYLLTFIIGFSGRLGIITHVNRKALPYFLILLCPFLYYEAAGATRWMLVIHLLAFGSISLASISKLYELRPASEDVPRFYLCVAFGGVCGGIFVSIVAPLIFSTILEYPLFVISAGLLVGDLSKKPAFRWRILAMPCLILVLLPLARMLPDSLRQFQMLMVFGLPAIITFTQRRHAILFCLCFALITLSVGMFEKLTRATTVFAERNFYGVKRVSEDETFNFFLHGGTIHGIQYKDPAKSSEPLGYYSRGGPFGEVFSLYQNKKESMQVGLVGLGIGSLASYARETDHFTFFELDPQIDALASKDSYFTHIQQCGTKCHSEIGDGRILLEKYPGQFSLLVLDAFSSDGIPVHLLSKEALNLFHSKVVSDGIILFHISNRYLDLRYSVAAVAKSLGFTPLVKADMESDSQIGRMPATLVAVTLNPLTVEELKTRGWTELHPGSDMRVWTDDYSSLWSVFVR